MVAVDRLAFDKSLGILLDGIEELYQEMDRGYARAAAHYGFECTGCTDNCCFSRFYHHTYLEYIYLRRGFAQREQSQQQEARKRAEKYVEALDLRESKAGDEAFRMICPLNESGWCILYSRRPMICRLHGLPHELAPPGRPRIIFSHGCQEFAAKCGHKPYFPFDRTGFYIQMSALEGEFKKNLGISGKSKKTVAHMIVCDEVTIL